MARIRTPERVKPVMAIWMSRCAVPRYGELAEILAETLSPIESKSDWFLPPDTAYYRREMAPDLQKRVVSFRNLMSIDQLPDLKIRSNALEDLWREQGRRTINLDPGYVSAPKFVLASAKDYSHRLYIGSGIFGDLQLSFVQGGFQTLPWTYPDYRDPAIIAFLEQARAAFMQQGGSPHYHLKEED